MAEQGNMGSTIVEIITDKKSHLAAIYTQQDIVLGITKSNSELEYTATGAITFEVGDIVSFDPPTGKLLVWIPNTNNPFAVVISQTIFEGASTEVIPVATHCELNIGAEHLSQFVKDNLNYIRGNPNSAIILRDAPNRATE